MAPHQVLLINIGSNSKQRNGVAPIYNDGTFEYWPIEESSPGRHTPTFKSLGLNCPHPHLKAHYDPRFEPTPTYGDKTDVKAFRALRESGSQRLLLFAASLRYKRDASRKPARIPPGIGYYIIGFFIVHEVLFPQKSGTMKWHGHKHNAHYLRPFHDKGKVKLIVEGTGKSRLLKKAFPISIRTESGLEPSAWLKRHFRELRGGPISNGPWYRRSLINAPSATSKAILKELKNYE